MRIDSHQHFWRYNPEEYGWIDDSMSSLQRDFLPADLKPELESVGFDAAIAVQARHSLEETRWLLELAEQSPFIAGVVGWVDLQSADVRSQLLELAQNPKLLGIRHIVQSEPDDHFLLRPDCLKGIATLEEFELTFDILIYARHLPVATDCKLSGLVTEADWMHWTPEHIKPYLDIALECFGPDRLMIGSDWPVCTVAGPYPHVMNLVIDYLSSHSAEVREAILGANAGRLWNLSSRLARPDRIS